MEKNKKDEIGIARCDGFVKGQLVFGHGEEKRDLFPSTGFMVEKLCGEVAAAFIEGSARNDFK